MCIWGLEFSSYGAGGSKRVKKSMSQPTGCRTHSDKSMFAFLHSRLLHLLVEFTQNTGNLFSQAAFTLNQYCHYAVQTFSLTPFTSWSSTSYAGSVNEVQQVGCVYVGMRCRYHTQLIDRLIRSALLQKLIPSGTNSPMAVKWNLCVTAFCQIQSTLFFIWQLVNLHSDFPPLISFCSMWSLVFFWVMWCDIQEK